MSPAFAAFLLLAAAWFVVMRLVGRAWLDGRLSGRQTGIVAGSMTTLAIGVPILFQVVQRGESLVPALVSIAFLAVVLIPGQVGLMDYGEKHGVREALRRQAERRRRD
jgi:hypothetical protein